MVEQFKTINLAIELAGLVLCALGSVLACAVGTLEKNTKKYFLLFFIALFVNTICNMTGQILRGMSGSGIRAALYIANYGEFALTICITIISTKLLLSLIDKEKKWKKLNIIIWSYFCFEIALLTISQFTGLYYIIDANNVYHRANGYFISIILSELVVLFNIALIIKYRKSLSRTEKIAFGIYFAVPFVATVIQGFIYGIYFTLFSEIFSALTMFIFILTEQTREYYRKKQENLEMKTAVMLSQIQPHFLYNTLNNIYRLCKGNEEAQTAVLYFSNFLETNMHSLEEHKPVPFSTEREHTEKYIHLRKLSMGEYLSAVFDCEEEGFFIPSLTVQPLVENAIKHGIGKQYEGGTVTIRTRRGKDAFIVTVEDDGVGFDTSKEITDKEKHIGIKSVRERLLAMVGGTLDIQSEIGKGTVCTITIPFEGMNK